MHAYIVEYKATRLIDRVTEYCNGEYTDGSGRTDGVHALMHVRSWTAAILNASFTLRNANAASVTVGRTQTRLRVDAGFA